MTIIDKKTSINSRIKDLEDKQNLKINDYTDLIGIKQSKYYRMIREGVDVSTQDVLQICDRLNLSKREKIWVLTGIDIGEDQKKVIEKLNKEVEALKNQNYLLTQTVYNLSQSNERVRIKRPDNNRAVKSGSG